MSRIARLLIWIGCSMAIVASLAVFAIYRIHAGIVASVDHKSAKTTTATVVSVTEMQKAGCPTSDHHQ
jgi:uncharacterized membrane protein